jgi:hypothetical protein
MTDLAKLAAFITSDRITRTSLADGTGVLLDVEGLHVYSLNETGNFLVERLCEGAASEDELALAVVREFEVDEATALADTRAFLADLEGFFAREKPARRRKA